MAVAEKPPSPPPPPRTVLTPMQALVRFVLAPMLALARVVLVAGRAFPYLCFAISWALSATCAAMVVAHLAWGEGSAPYVFLLALMEAAVKVCCKCILVALVAVLMCDRFLVEFASGSDPELKKSPFEAIMEESAQGLFWYFRVVLLGWVAVLALLPLMVAGMLVMIMSSLVEGSISKGEAIGSVIMDVALLCFSVISCFVIFPAMVLGVWRKYREEPSQFC